MKRKTSKPTTQYAICPRKGDVRRIEVRRFADDGWFLLGRKSKERRIDPSITIALTGNERAGLVRLLTSE